MQKVVQPGGDLMGPDDVRIVTFEAGQDGQAVKIGGQTHADVYAGRMRLSGGSLHNVAIKRFRTHLTDQEAAGYEAVISNLKSAGVKLPRFMGMVKLPKGTRVGGLLMKESEWVQVSELLGSAKGGSDLVKKSKGLVLTEKGRMEAALELTKVANAGYLPAIDLFEPFIDESKGVMVFDIDTIVKLHMRFGKALPPGRASWLLNSVEELSVPLAADEPERERLLRACLQTASPDVKTELEKIVPLDKI